MATSKAFEGELETGQAVRNSNLRAVTTIGNIMKSSLGPQGLDKLIIDEIGEVTITNDGATILKKLQVEHPIAKLLVELSSLQDAEIGDGTTSVVVFASELIKRAHTLMNKEGMHATSIIHGYKMAAKEAIKFMNSYLSTQVNDLDKATLINVAKTSMSSKLLTSDSAMFAQLCVTALESASTTDENGLVKYPVKAINILKCHGKSLKDSYLINGYALERVGRAAQGMPISVKDAKIALIDFPLKQYRAQLGVQIEITDAKELEHVREKERDICQAKIATIAASGANVLLSTQGLDDLALKYLVDYGIFAVRRVSKLDMKRIAKCTGGTVVISMSTVEDDNEVFDPQWLGNSSEVSEEKLGDWDMVLIKETKEDKSMCIVLRGANEYMLDEAERSLHDALCVTSKTLESKSVVGGGGCTEVAMSCYLDSFSRTLGSKEQSSIKAFSDALLSIPKVLAMNAALDSNDLVAKLRAVHTQGQRDIQNYDKYKNIGLDLENEAVHNCVDNGISEPTMNKRKAVRYATDAAITILRIDDIIKLHERN